MTEGAGSRAGAQPADLWGRWHDANSRMWSNMLGDGGEALMDPFGIYRQWFGGLEEAGKPATGAGSQEVWLQWAEATAGAWQRAFGMGSVVAGMGPYWAEMAEGLRKEMVEGGLPTDPLDLYLRWYNAANAPLSKMIREILENETFLEDSRRFLENLATVEQVFQRSSEEFFGYLQLGTRSDSTRVAELVVGLDAKVDRMEEAFEEFEHGYASPATEEAVESLEGRLERLERRLDEDRSERRRMEGKLDTLLAALGTSANGGPPGTGAAGTNNAAPRGEEVDATDAARRKARELGVDLGEVEGSGPGGRVTVDDVRRKGGEAG